MTSNDHISFTAQLMSFNRHIALDRVGGDEELLKEVVEIFLMEYPQLMGMVTEAVGKQDALLLERAAHSLKGSLSTIGAEVAANCALALEMMGRTRKLDGCETVLAELQSSVSQLHLELTAMIAA
jgi:HPt (histidine-containing phosphotransfer) domain-containing protein